MSRGKAARARSITKYKKVIAENRDAIKNLETIKNSFTDWSADEKAALNLAIKNSKAILRKLFWVEKENKVAEQD